MSTAGFDERRKARQAKLDAVVDDYIRDMINHGDMPAGIVGGWVCGISVVHFSPDGTDSDGLLVENQPNLNTFLARGVADATAERFQQQATGYYEDDE